MFNVENDLTSYLETGHALVQRQTKLRKVSAYIQFVNCLD